MIQLWDPYILADNTAHVQSLYSYLYQFLTDLFLELMVAILVGQTMFGSSDQWSSPLTARREWDSCPAE